jgi:hypothetical protein
MGPRLLFSLVRCRRAAKEERTKEPATVASVAGGGGTGANVLSDISASLRADCRTQGS